MTIQYVVPASGVGAGVAVGAGKSPKNRTFVLGPGAVTGDKVGIEGSTNDGASFQQLIDKDSGKAIVLTLTVLTDSGPEAVIDDDCDTYRMRRLVAAPGSALNRVDLNVAAADTPTPGDLATLALGNFVLGGSIGTAADTVDQFSAFTIAQTTAGQTLTIPNPTDPSPTRAPYYFQNIGTVSFIMLGIRVLPNSVLEATWNGTAWHTVNTGTTDGVDTTIGSQAATAFTEIDGGSGGVQVVTSDEGPITLETSGTLGGSGDLILETAGATIHVGSFGAAAKDVNVGSVVGASSTSVHGGTGGVSVGADAVAMPVTIGNITGATAVNILAGTSGMNVGADAVDHAVTIGSITGASLTTIRGGTAGVNVGADAVAHPVIVGSVTGAATTSIRAGTGALNIIRNGVTWQWPNALGAAGSQLTDAAGNGVLSWA